MAVLTAAEALALSNQANTLTASQFEQQFPTIVSGIAAATAAGRYSIDISLTQNEYDRVRLFLTNEPQSNSTVRYTVRTNRDGAASIDSRSTRISWELRP